MDRLGIVGFANTGKSTVFNALTGLQVTTAPHPFSTHEPNLGVATLPDAKLDQAAVLEGSAKVVHATLELLDLPALGHGGSGGPAGHYLARLREMDGLIMVLRAFAGGQVPSEESGLDPAAQAEALSLELTIADAEVFERRLPRLEKEATAAPALRPTLAAITAGSSHLAGGHPLRTAEWSPQQVAAFRDLAPLTLKPAIWVVNVDEDEDHPERYGLEGLVPRGDTVVAISARLEEEAASLPEEERADLYAGLGLGEGALRRVVQAAYTSLGLISFYTLGPKEAHAWTVRAGATAAEAAGKIHTDLERGFIRAEVCGIDQLLATGGWQEAKKAGAVRVEGRTYQVQEGEVILVRFSV
jgi:hypothetical protein